MREPLESWFFISYAWADNPDNDPDGSSVSKFFGLVQNSVAAKVGDNLEKRGFLDKRSIENGDEWKVELVRALRGCRTFVPLYTQRYFARDACGREWAAFEARQAAHGKDPGLILPVLWDKPSRVDRANRRSDLQAMFDEARFGNDLGRLQEYKRLGMSALMQRYDTDGEAKTTVAVIVDALTDQIVERWETNGLPVAPDGIVKPWDDLVPAFGAPTAAPPAAPTHAIYVSVAAASGDEMRAARRGALAYYPGDERDWIPYPESALTTISQLALEAVYSLGVRCRWLDAKKELAKNIRGLETQGNTPVIILVDPWSLEVAALEQSLSEFDQNRFKNAMVIVACNPHEKPAESFVPSPDRWATVEQKLRSVFGRSFPLNGESADFVSNIRDIDELRRAVGTALKAMRGIVAIEKPAARRVASTDGVPMNQN